MTADTAYQIVQFAANKSQKGYITPPQFMLIMNQAQRSYMDYLCGAFQSYQVGHPAPTVGLGQNEIIRQRLTPLIDAPTTLNIGPDGFAAYPAGYQQADAMFTMSMDRVRYVQQHKLYSYLNDPVDPINTNPVYVIESGGFRFYPNTVYNGTNIAQAKLSFIKIPPDIVWSYTLDANGRSVYNPGASSGLVFYDIDSMEIIARALKLVGISLQVQQLEQFADQIKSVGQ